MTMLLRDWCRGLLLLSAGRVAVGRSLGSSARDADTQNEFHHSSDASPPAPAPLFSVDEALWRTNSIPSHHASQHYNRRPLCRKDTALGHVKQRLFPYMPHYEAKRSEAVILAQACKRLCSSGRIITMVSLDRQVASLAIAHISFARYRLRLTDDG